MGVKGLSKLDTGFLLTKAKTHNSYKNVCLEYVAAYVCYRLCIMQMVNYTNIQMICYNGVLIMWSLEISNLRHHFISTRRMQLESTFWNLLVNPLEFHDNNIPLIIVLKSNTWTFAQRSMVVSFTCKFHHFLISCII